MKLSFDEYLKIHPYKETRSFTKEDWESSMYEKWKEESTVILSSESLEDAINNLRPMYNCIGDIQLWDYGFEKGAIWKDEQLKKQYAELIKSHAELLEALKKVNFVIECNRATNGVSLEIMYQTEYWEAKQAIEKANNIKNNKL